MAETRELASKKGGLHFNAVTSIEDQIERFNIERIATHLDDHAPLLSGLLGGLLASDPAIVKRRKAQKVKRRRKSKPAATKPQETSAPAREHEATTLQRGSECSAAVSSAPNVPDDVDMEGVSDGSAELWGAFECESEGFDAASCAQFNENHPGHDANANSNLADAPLNPSMASLGGLLPGVDANGWSEFLGGACKLMSRVDTAALLATSGGGDSDSEDEYWLNDDFDEELLGELDELDRAEEEKRYLSVQTMVCDNV